MSDWPYGCGRDGRCPDGRPADACAFMLKRHLMQKDDSFSFFGVMRPQIVFYDRDEVWMVQAS